ncbi:MAG TPA: hypothetical protein EYP41_07900 [Anaerolineae bacterium]|nr:hypothetical protein [Anaerolineae bacterium]
MWGERYCARGLVRRSGSKQWRLCTLSPLEFIRRFLQHVLPKGFVTACG